jgi:predicted esterase
VARAPHTVEPTPPHLESEENSRHGRLAFCLQPPTTSPTRRTGLQTFDGSDGTQVGLAYVPSGWADGPFRVVVLLHGSGGSARQGIELMLPIADRHRLLLLAPKSQWATWDVIMRGFGPDVRRIDRLLDEVSALWPVDRLAVGGFSDGASYALSLGIANGDLFDSVVAFSPGFAASVIAHGAPRLFISHGINDEVLPINDCSRRLVPRLEQVGYPVTYVEFDGTHTVPAELVQQAATWLATTPSPRQHPLDQVSDDPA